MISIGDRKLAFSAHGVILAFVVAALAYSTATSAQNNDKVKAGLAIWKTTGCADCHGLFADGDRKTTISRSGRICVPPNSISRFSK
jgi:mono/diheme cytochrome c family protein